MGRPKSYERDEVLAKAMTLFWRRGFHATSTRELAAAMGVNAYSLFAEFGSKEGLYEAALERYMATVVTDHFGRLEAPGAGLADVRAVLDAFGDNGVRDASGLGCLLGSTGAERAPTIEASREHTERFIQRVVAAFAHALTAAVERGELRPTTPVQPLAAAFTTHLMGVFAMSRARVEATVIRAASDVQLRTLASFCP